MLQRLFSLTQVVKQVLFTWATKELQGTSPQNHAVGTKIIDASKVNRVEFGTLAFGANNDPEQAYWNSASSSLADSTTHIAQFLKDKPGSYFN